MTAEVRIKLFANSLPVGKFALSKNDEAPENVRAFRGLMWLRGHATTETDI